MNNKLRKFLLYIDYKIYLIKWIFNIHICSFLLKYEKDSWKRARLISKIIGEPFYSKFMLPYPNIIEKIASIKNENK